MSLLKKLSILILPVVLVVTAFNNTGCNIYKFNDIDLPDSIKVIKVNFIENRATYVNPQLSPQLSDKLRQKIVSQTRLKQTSGDNADWEISGTITDYSFSTAGISNNQTSTNRINISVTITRFEPKSGESKEYSIARNFDFPASQTLQQAETALLPDIIKGLSDDIFNQLFSGWK